MDLPPSGTGADQPADVKQEAGQQVALKVVNADGAEVFFKIKKQTALKKLMEAYIKNQDIAYTSVDFWYHGNPVEEDKTPEDLGMEDDDVILANIAIQQNRALEEDPKNAQAWNNLGFHGGGTVKGVSYTKTQCYVRALEEDPKYPNAWASLGLQGGGAVKGVAYTTVQCYEKALEENPKHGLAWNNLGIEGGGTVKGVRYTPAQCAANFATNK